ncbi:hypothetical protein M0R45_019573 [Rubus argutus]|uniref:DUF4218 domain-containing protein n=1 Tax=Rubus argutus TaxID=59490 RepID=A0AAW1X686_RUBAR
MSTATFPDGKLGNLQDYVRNRARPEGSIVEGYIAEESLTFCSMYLNDIETIFTQPERNYDGGEKKKSNVVGFCSKFEPFKIQHYELLKRESPFKLEERQRDQFPKWFKGHVEELYSQGSSHVTEEMYALSFGPVDTMGTYTMCNANGVRLHVKQLQQTKTVENSGIMVPGSHNNGENDFYGQLGTLIDDDFIDDNLLDKELLSGDEDDTQESDEYSDLD